MRFSTHLRAILSLATLSLAQNSSTSEIVPLLQASNLVPGVIPSFNATVGPLDITYPQGIVNYGNALNLSTVMYSPEVQFPGEADYPDAQYTCRSPFLSIILI